MTYPPPDNQPPYGEQPYSPPPGYPPTQPSYEPPPGYAPSQPPPGYAPSQPSPGYPPPGYVPAGYPPPGYPQGYSATPYTVAAGVPQSNGLATASLILGICSILFGILTAIPAVITGHIALNRIKANPALADSRGQAIAGLVLGYVIGGLTILCVGGFLVLGVIAANTPQTFTS